MNNTKLTEKLHVWREKNTQKNSTLHKEDRDKEQLGERAGIWTDLEVVEEEVRVSQVEDHLLHTQSQRHRGRRVLEHTDKS